MSQIKIKNAIITSTDSGSAINLPSDTELAGEPLRNVSIHPTENTGPIPREDSCFSVTCTKYQWNTAKVVPCNTPRWQSRR